MDENTRDILEALDFIKEHMATKDDLAAFRSEFEEFREETRENFASLHAEIRDIRHRLDTPEEIARNNAAVNFGFNMRLPGIILVSVSIGTGALNFRFQLRLIDRSIDRNMRAFLVLSINQRIRAGRKPNI